MPFELEPFFGTPKVPERPRLHIKIIKDTLETPQFALIDTGANYCYLPRCVAKQLKIKLKSGKKIKVYDSTGKTRWGYMHNLTVKFYGTELYSNPKNITFTTNPKLTIPDLPIIFVRHLKEPLLGVTNFLDSYVYAVNHAKKKFSLRCPNKNRECEICKPGT